VGSEIRVADESLASFDERFADGKVKKRSLAGYPHFASLEVGPGAGVLVDGASVFTPSSAMLPAEPSDSFAERFAGTKVVSQAADEARRRAHGKDTAFLHDVMDDRSK
jgi:hypothetical protein